MVVYLSHGKVLDGGLTVSLQSTRWWSKSHGKVKDGGRQSHGKEQDFSVTVSW